MCFHTLTHARFGVCHLNAMTTENWALVLRVPSSPSSRSSALHTSPGSRDNANTSHCTHNQIIQRFAALVHACTHVSRVLEVWLYQAKGKGEALHTRLICASIYLANLMPHQDPLAFEGNVRRAISSWSDASQEMYPYCAGLLQKAREDGLLARINQRTAVAIS